jgi:hypothetical protein
MNKIRRKYFQAVGINEHQPYISMTLSFENKIPLPY